MKVLSLLQPWATLVVIGAKKIETRSWDTKHRGEILIHASLNKKVADKMIWNYPFNKVLTEYFNHAREPDIDDLPFGAIIGKVNLEMTMSTDVIRKGEVLRYGSSKKWQFTDQELAFGDYSPDRYGWLLSDPVKFETPIPCKGALSLWSCPVGVLSEISKQNNIHV